MQPGFRDSCLERFASTIPACDDWRRSIIRTDLRLDMWRSTAILLCALFFATPAGAATCGGDFHTFLAGMARDAAAAGISRGVIDSAFAGLTPDPAVLT